MADVAAISASKDKAQASFADRARRHHHHPRLGAGPTAVHLEPVPPPEPLGNVLLAVVVIIAVLVVIGILLDIAGMPIGGWRLSAMEPSHELEQPAGRRKGRRRGDRRCRLESKSNRVLAPMGSLPGEDDAVHGRNAPTAVIRLANGSNRP